MDELPPKTDRKWNLTVTLPEDLRRALRPLRQAGQIQVSQVVERALRDAMADATAPGKAAVVRRLRLARSHHRGTDYDLGFAEGRRWAEDVATWDEIRRYAGMPSQAIAYTAGSNGAKFDGPFTPPADYPDAPFYHGRDGLLVKDRQGIFPYWEGWLAGVYSVHSAVAEEMGSVHPTPSFVRERPADLVADLEAVRAQFASEAREEFGSGYRAGVEAAKSLSWHFLSDFAGEAFDLHRWLLSLEHAWDLERRFGIRPGRTAFPNAGQALAKALGALVNPDEDFYPPITYQEGFTQALRDIWESVQRDTSTPSNKRLGGESAMRPKPKKRRP